MINLTISFSLLCFQTFFFNLQICQIVLYLFVGTFVFVVFNKTKLKQNNYPPPHPTKHTHTPKTHTQKYFKKKQTKNHTKIIILSTHFCQHNLKYTWMISYPCNQTFTTYLECRYILKGCDTVFESIYK